MPEPAVLSRAPSQERILLDAVKRLERFRAGRIAVHIRLSGLADHNKRRHYMRIATETFAESVKGFEGQLFKLENGDLFFLAVNVAFETLDAVVNRIRILFSDDPFVQFHDSEESSVGFCLWYRLEHDYDALLKGTQEILRQAEQARLNSSTSTPPAKRPTPLEPGKLARIEQALVRADVTNIARRQTVCTLIQDTPPQPLFEEIYVSIEDLQEIVTPDVDILANRWLFQYLTQTLDRRVLMMLIHNGMNGGRAFSLNLNIATILSPDFARFESAVPPALRGRLVVEMNKLDVFSDMGEFLFARDYLHDHGFRLCLDGLTHRTLPYYHRSRLGFDLMKIYWTPNSVDNAPVEHLPEIARIVADAGQARTILCRCETEQALHTGQRLGITMFQGRIVDRILASHRAASVKEK